MRIEVRFAASRAGAADLTGATAVVVDVLRATSSIVEALAQGALAIYPAGSTDEAMRLVQSLGREDLLLCGESRGSKIEGYDLGNSPSEFTADVVAGKRLVMNTTNGTPTFLVAEAGDRIVAASFMNLASVTDALAGCGRIVVLCAGRQGHFALEDAVCAGLLIRRLEAARGDELALGDGARAARVLCETVDPGVAFLAGTDAGRALVAAGLEADLETCARLDCHHVVPEMHERVIRLGGSA